MEEAGVAVSTLVYVRSRTFPLTRGVTILIAEFLCKWKSGAAHIADPEEVESVAWMTPDEIRNYLKSPAWTVDTLAAMEAKRIELGW
jgi:8-oxo-dGTP diphosphatase